MIEILSVLPEYYKLPENSVILSAEGNCISIFDKASNNKDFCKHGAIFPIEPEQKSIDPMLKSSYTNPGYNNYNY